MIEEGIEAAVNELVEEGVVVEALCTVCGVPVYRLKVFAKNSASKLDIVICNGCRGKRH